MQCLAAIYRLSPHWNLHFHISRSCYCSNPSYLHLGPACKYICASVEREWGQDGALSHISGCTLAELSSLACTGYTSQLRGNHSVGNIRFHLSPIQSGTYLEQLGGCACHKPKNRAKACFKDVKISGDQYNLCLSLGWQNVFVIYNNNNCFIYFVIRFLFIFPVTVFTLCFQLFFSDLHKVPLKYSYFKICLSTVKEIAL